MVYLSPDSMDGAMFAGTLFALLSKSCASFRRCAMCLHRESGTLAGLLFVAFVAICCLTGCPQSSPETGHSEEEHSHHNKSPAHHHEGNHPFEHDNHETGTSSERSGESPAEVAEKARAVLKYIDEHNEAPTEYEGGRVFHNSGGSGEQLLPRHDDSGRAITYREWDVNPKLEGVNRGTERLVTGSDGSAYMTADHYKTFTKIR
jgi:ribonuclease T1